ncbi:MAG: Sapep family Mn(2+)-dependent dipeptidase [Polyangiaceae bacterium]
MVRARFEREEARRFVPLLCEVIRFRTIDGETAAHAQQKAWLLRVAKELGLVARDAGLVTEIELPGPAGAPVLGLVVHGDVQPVDESKWTIPPFAGVEKDGHVLGRGAADDKGPLVAALLAMKSLKESGARLTHTVRLLVGSDEESQNQDFETYLKSHEPPYLSLVLDSAFPVVVGEKAWNALTVSAELEERAGGPVLPYRVAELDAGLSPSIVPDRAELTLEWKGAGSPNWRQIETKFRQKTLPQGASLAFETAGGRAIVRVTGKAAHGGMNLEGGRNALIALARATEGALPRGGADDLLNFARLAGRDFGGGGLGLVAPEPNAYSIWGGYTVNVATIKKPTAPSTPTTRELMVVARRPPPLTGPELRAKLEKVVSDFNTANGARLVTGGFWDDEPLVFDPEAKVVKRLLAAYARATGKPEPVQVSAGGTYAKRLPRSIAFGMWFPGKPYPGHDVDEKVPVSDLMRSAEILIEALVDIAGGAPMVEPFKP